MPELLRTAPGKGLATAFLVGAWAALLLLGCGGSPPAPADLPPLELPRPDLSGFEPASQQQVEELQQRVLSLHATLRSSPSGTGDSAPETPPTRATLAKALGELGNQYHAFLFLEAAESCYRQAARFDPDDPRWPYYEGVTLGHQGRDEEAVRAFERARELDPDDLATRIRLGDLYLKLGRVEDAQESYRRATEIDPETAAAWFGLGRTAVLAGDDAAAVRHFEKTLELAPEASAVHYPLAQAHRRLGDADSAQRHLALHGEGGLGFPDPRMQTVLQREVDTSIDTLRSLAAQPDRMSAEELYQTALGQLGATGGALERFRHRVETEGPGVSDPSHQARLYFVLGRMLLDADRPEAAARHLGRALELDPSLETGELRLRLADILLRQGDPAAEGHLQRALELDLPAADRALAWHRLGELARRRDRPRQAVERYRQALDLDPGLLDARLGLATALGRLGSYQAAVREYRRALAVAPDNVGARLGEATALVLSGRLPEARRRLEEGLQVAPDSVPLARTLAQILASAPDPAVRDGERALELARRVMEAKPDAAGAETLAMALAQNGRFDEAVRVQEELVRRAEQAGNPAVTARLRANLERYRDGRPCCAGG